MVRSRAEYQIPWKLEGSRSAEVTDGDGIKALEAGPALELTKFQCHRNNASLGVCATHLRKQPSFTLQEWTRQSKPTAHA